MKRSEGCNWAIVDAAEQGRFEVVRYLVENTLGLDRIQIAINCAGYNGYYEIVKSLLRPS